MKKRLFSILLALCMVLGLVPATAFAEGETKETPACTCETACTMESMNPECPVCGEDGALPENCGKYIESIAEGAVQKPEEQEQQETPEGGVLAVKPEVNPEPTNGEAGNDVAIHNAGVAINNTNFPDANFCSFVAEEFDTDKDNYLSDEEIAAVKVISCQNKNISDLTGIGFFTALVSLSCYENKLTTLDISKNVALHFLDCTENQLTLLDVSKNTSLEWLSCYKNQLTALDVSKNKALTTLHCNSNQLTTLDISKNTNLQTLYCYTNQLTSLDVSKNTQLSILTCYNNAYQIILDENRTFDLSTLPGSFDVSKASNWSGGTVNGNILTVDNDKDTVTYTYDCGNGKTTNFTLKCTQVIQGLNLYVNTQHSRYNKNSVNQD